MITVIISEMNGWREWTHRARTRGSAPISSKSLTLSIKTIIYHVVNRHIRTQYLRYHLVGLLPPKDCLNL